MRCSTVEVLGNSSQSIYARATAGPVIVREGEGEWGVECEVMVGWVGTLVVGVRERSSNIDTKCF